MRASERVAKAIVETIIPGAEMRPITEQSHGECDFVLVLPTGGYAVVEVTTSHDRQYIETRAALTKPKKRQEFVRAEKVKNSWLVHPTSGARVSETRSRVDRYLAEIERAGLTDFYFERDAGANPSVAQIWTDLQIEAGAIFNWTTPNTIGISLPVQGGEMVADSIVRSVNTEASKSDNQLKLDRSQCESKHLFVLIDPSDSLGSGALIRGLTPISAPKLPQQITHVWVAGEAHDPGVFRVLRFDRTSGWTTCGEVSVSIPTPS